MQQQSRDPDYEARVRGSFARQKFMAHVGAALTRLAPGEVDITLPHRPELTQQHGFFHAGVTATLADTAAGYAALSLYPPGAGVLTTEFKINLLRPAAGERLVARGRVLRSGKTLTICRSDVFGMRGETESHIATALLTMIRVEELAD